MIKIRHGDDRGIADLGWLYSKHSFSFAHYHDPEHMGFGPLRVINEDKVQPGAGFDTHGHKDMEIISYVLDGALEHKDSIGTGSVIRPGEVQRMTAGSGIRHSEFNHSSEAPVHFFQIWVLPDTEGLQPGYEQKDFPTAEKSGVLKLVGSRDGREGSVTIHQDVNLYASLLAESEEVIHALADGRKAWVQIARGSVTVNGSRIQAGDGVAVADEQTIAIKAAADTELLLFDMG